MRERPGHGTAEDETSKWTLAGGNSVIVAKDVGKRAARTQLKAGLPLSYRRRYIREIAGLRHSKALSCKAINKGLTVQSRA